MTFIWDSQKVRAFENMAFIVDINERTLIIVESTYIVQNLGQCSGQKLGDTKMNANGHVLAGTAPAVEEEGIQKSKNRNVRRTLAS